MDSRYVEFEDILQEVGSFGTYQKCLLLALIPVSILSSFQSNTIHLKLVPDHWCFVPELANFSFGEQHRLIRPIVKYDNSCNAVVRDQCLMFDIDYNHVSNELHLPQNNDTKSRKLLVRKCDNGWLYERSLYWDSFAMHFDFVCEFSDNLDVIQNVRQMASILGTPLFALMADIYGRRLAYLSILITSLVSSISPILSTNYTVFIVCQFIIGMTFPSSHLIILILVLEFMCPKDRAKTVSCVWIAIQFGLSLHSLIIYFIPHWLWITVLNAISVLAMIFALKFIPESLQWLLVKGDYNSVDQGFKEIMNINNKSIEEDLLLMQIQKIGKLNKSDEKPKPVNCIVMKVLSETTLSQMLLILTICLAVNMITKQVFESKVFVLNKSELLFDHMLWSLIVLVPIVSTWFLMQRRVGRRLTNAIILSLIAMNLILIMNTDNSYAKYWLSLLGLFFNTGSVMITCVQLIELSPTTYRCSCVALCLSLASVAVKVVNFVHPISNYDNQWIYLVVLTTTSLTTSFVMTFVTESLRENIPQNVLSSEVLLNSMKYWKLGKRRCDLKSNIFKSLSKWDLNEELYERDNR